MTAVGSQRINARGMSLPMAVGQARAVAKAGGVADVWMGTQASAEVSLGDDGWHVVTGGLFATEESSRLVDRITEMLEDYA